MTGRTAADECIETCVASLGKCFEAGILPIPVVFRTYESDNREITTSRRHSITDRFVDMFVIEAIAKDNQTVVNTRRAKPVTEVVH